MAFLYILIRTGLATLFLSTALAKLKDIEKHFLIVKDYHLLPAFLVKPFGFIEIIAECFVGVLLLIGLLQIWGAVLAALLLLTFCFAIVINLLRGRRQISCGCGGLAGTHSLSWWLVLRNIGLVFLSLFLFKTHHNIGSFDGLLLGHTFREVFPFQAFLPAFTFWSITLILLIILNFHSAIQYMQKLLGNRIKGEKENELDSDITS